MEYSQVKLKNNLYFYIKQYINEWEEYKGPGVRGSVGGGSGRGGSGGVVFIYIYSYWRHLNENIVGINLARMSGMVANPNRNRNRNKKTVLKFTIKD